MYVEIKETKDFATDPPIVHWYWNIVDNEDQSVALSIHPSESKVAVENDLRDIYDCLKKYFKVE